MSAPYDFRRVTPDVYGDKRPVEGDTVALLHIAFEDRFCLDELEFSSSALINGVLFN